MRIGYACLPLGIQFKTNRKMILKNYTQQKWLQMVKENLDDLIKILGYNVKNNIFLFRISSNVLPFGSHEVLDIDWQRHFKKQLEVIGAFVRANHMRVSMHPGQYTVLNSPNEKVVMNAMQDLLYHTHFLDSLGVNAEHKIILHIGGVYGDKEEAIKQFEKNYRKLPDKVKARLVIENDDRHFNIDDVLRISYDCHIPVIYDNLHHDCCHNDLKTIPEILHLVKETWTQKDGPVKVHYSQQAEGKKIGAHAKRVYSPVFMEYYKNVMPLDIDIMLETKDKDISAIKCKALINEFCGQPQKHLTDQWAKYKYLLMERNYAYYKTCSQLVKEGCSYKTFYTYVDDTLNCPIDKGNFINAAEHVWGYVNEESTFRESSHYRKLLTGGDYKKIKAYLYKLALKYQKQYLLDSYYFWY